MSKINLNAKTTKIFYS